MRYLITVSICWIALYAIYHLFLRRETFFGVNRAYLLGSLVLGAVIPGYQWLPVEWFIQEDVVSTYIMPVYHLQETVFVTAADTWTWVDTLWCLYTAGVFIALFRLLHGIWSIYRLRDAAVHEYIGGVRIIRTSHAHLPFSFGSAVYVSDIVDLEIDIEQLIRHEQVHINDRHTIDVLIVEVFKVFFWFNPILILYKKALQQAHEYVADAMVIKDFSRKSYGQLLLRQSQSGMEIALANHFFHSQIKKRIQMMYQQQSKRSAMVKYLAALPVLAALVIFFSAYRPSENVGLEEQVQEIVTTDMSHYDRSKALYDLVQDQHNTGGDMLVVAAIMDKYGIDVSLDGEKPTICYMHDKMASARERLLTAETRPNNSSDNLNLHIGTSIDATDDGVIEIPRRVADDTIPLPLNPPAAERVPAALPSPPSAPNPPTPPALNDQTTLPSIHVVGFGQKTNQSTPTKLTTSTVDDQDGEVYKQVDIMPAFPGCEDQDRKSREFKICSQDKLLRYIYTNVKYPKAAREAGEEGMTVVQFVVDASGQVTTSKIVRDVGTHGLGDAAMAVVDQMRSEITWLPGMQDDKAVSVLYTLPIKFKLASNDEDSDTQVAEDKPLIYVDGKYYGDNADDIDPDDIEAISVLKGEKAIAKYGDKGLNGVIEITMKASGQGEGSSSKVYKKVDLMPAFPGCEDLDRLSQEFESCSQHKLLEYVYSNVMYPAEAREAGAQGTTVVQFVVRKDGVISTSKLLRDGGHPALGKAAMNVVKRMTRDVVWMPGRQNDEAVNVQFTLPIKFKLADDSNDSQAKESAKQGITLRPNPAHGAFAIDLSGINGVVQVSVSDLAGRLLYDKSHRLALGQTSIEIEDQQFTSMSAIVAVRSGDQAFTEQIVFE